MSKGRIFYVEDDEDTQEMVKYNLEKYGFQVDCEANGEKALSRVKQKKPDLLLLDVMLPGMDGLSLCNELRRDRDTRQIPIIMVSARSEEADIVAGMEVGANDYITKPFSPKVLLAKIRAGLRHYVQQIEEDTQRIVRGPLTIDYERHLVTLEDREIKLTLSEFKLLHFLAKRPGYVFSRYHIVDAVRGENYHVTDRSVDVQMTGLRKKLGKHAGLVETVRGFGYRFTANP